MGVNASRVKYLQDSDSAVVLRNVADGAETATATETGISLNELDTAEWDDGKVIPYGVIAVQIYVTANDNTTGDETVTLALLVDDVAAMSDTPVVVWQQLLPVGFTGAITAYVDAKTIPLVDTDSSGSDKFLAIRATLAGTTPSVTYGAWIAKSTKW
jgi:hypothetical protein